MQDNVLLLQTICQLCSARETGTIFITTTENRACHLVMEQGRVIALSYGRYRGEQVVEMLAEMPIANFSFKQGIKMPLAGRSFVDDNFNVVEVLGFAANDETPESEKMTESKRVYRGQVLKTVDEAPAVSDSPRKKSVRMYRG
jgi:hypothetical protein